jgi:hypothetical protein
MQQLPPPTSPIGGKGLLGSNILTSPNTSLGENDPNDGGIVGQPLTTLTTPPLFGRNVGTVPQGGFFGHQPAATRMAAPPTSILTPEPTPSPTPDQPVPMFGLTQQPTPTLPPLFGQIAPQGRVQLSPTTSEGGEGGQDTQSRTILLTGVASLLSKPTVFLVIQNFPVVIVYQQVIGLQFLQQMKIHLILHSLLCLLR